MRATHRLNEGTVDTFPFDMEVPHPTEKDKFLPATVSAVKPLLHTALVRK